MGESSRQKRGIFCEKAIENHNRIVEKTVKKLKESNEISPGIPETATIAHTWIQKDSNFASLRGLDSHQSL